MGKQKGHLVVADDPNDDVAIKVEGVAMMTLRFKA